METTTPDTVSRGNPTFEVFNPPSIGFAKHAAKRLQKAHYTIEGCLLKLSAAQEAVARAYGHKDWFTLMRQTERDGYSQSVLDTELTAPLLAARRDKQRVALAKFLKLSPDNASSIAVAAQISIAPSAAPKPGKQTSLTDNGKSGLPLASPRPGLSEILLTAYPFSIVGIGVPLPGWKDYAVVAAPTDNTAMWVRFCDEQNIAVEAQQLVRAIKDLSGGALAVAHVPSQVRVMAPNLIAKLAADGVTISGGRPAIQAARLRTRLESVVIHVSMDLNYMEEPPSPDELVALLHGSTGLVEIPDSKNLRYDQRDLRPVYFAHELLRQIREQRWPHATKIPHPEKPARKEKRTEFWREEDGGIEFGSGVRPIARGTPVYRIRVELPLVDEYSDPERRVTITRVIDVPIHYDLWDLHVAIQDAMGWADCHLHEFTFYAARTGGKTITFASPNDDDPDQPASANEKLWDHISAFAARPALYRYDFGDCWDHSLTLVGTFPSDGGGYPRCISGERACPPEDCGSAPGYFRVLDVMQGGSAALAHAADISRKEMNEWLKGHVNVTRPYRPEHFDPASVEFDDPQERWDYAYGDVIRDD